MNLFSFRHYNTLDEMDAMDAMDASNNMTKDDIPLWSISRWSYSRHKGTTTYVASYNYYTKIYHFCEKRYVSYDDVVKDALSM